MRRYALLEQMLMKLSLEVADSNSRSIAGQSKMETLRTVQDGGGRFFTFRRDHTVVDPIIKKLS